MVRYRLSYVRESVVFVDIFAKPSVLIKPENGKFNLRCQPADSGYSAYKINYESIKDSYLGLFAENMEAFEREDDTHEELFGLRYTR